MSTRPSHFSPRLPLSAGVCVFLLTAVASAQTFQDATSTWISGGIPGKVAWGDYNGDGWVDLCAGGRIYRNNGGSSFTNTGQSTGGDSIWGDYNNDGNLDLFNYAGRALYRNTGTAFANDSGKLPSFAMSTTRGAAWADLDNDAFLDLYVGGYESPYQPDTILRNESGSQFTAAWTQSGDIDPARGITAADYDRDGDQDIYVSNYRLEANLLWRNNGDFSFTNVATNGGVAGEYDGWSYSYGHTIGSAWGDFDNDGCLDLFVGNFSHPDDWQDRAKFYRNTGPSGGYGFQLMDTFDGNDWQESYASPAVADYDNDGDLDLFFTTVYATGSYGIANYPRLYRNDGNWQFTNVTDSMGLGSLGPTYQAAWADVDNDGDLDLATAGKLFINNTQSTGRHWLKIGLEGDGETVNTAAIGAQVRVYAGGEIMTRQIEAGTGEGNQNDLTMHFGLGSYSQPVTVEILWPEGTIETVENVQIDQMHTWEWGSLSSEVFLGPGMNWNYDAYWKDGSSPGADSTLPGLRIENGVVLHYGATEGTTRLSEQGTGLRIGTADSSGGRFLVGGGSFIVESENGVELGVAGDGPGCFGMLGVFGDGVFHSAARVLIGKDAGGIGQLTLSDDAQVTIADALILGEDGGVGQVLLSGNASLQVGSLVIEDGFVSFQSGSEATLSVAGMIDEQYARLANYGTIRIDAAPISESFWSLFRTEGDTLMLASSFHEGFQGPGSDWNNDDAWIDGSSPGADAVLDENFYVIGGATLEHTESQGTTSVTGQFALGRPDEGGGTLDISGGVFVVQSQTAEIGVGGGPVPIVGGLTASESGQFVSAGDVHLGGGSGSAGILRIEDEGSVTILGELRLGMDGAVGIVRLEGDGSIELGNLVIENGWIDFASDCRAVLEVSGRGRSFFEDLVTAGFVRIGSQPVAGLFDDWFVVEQDTLMLAWTPLEGDLDGDGYVGSGDLDLVRANWGESVTPGDLSAGDASGDGRVDSADLDIVRGAWGSGVPAGPTSSSPVPEPSGWMLVVGVLFCLSRRPDRDRAVS